MQPKEAIRIAKSYVRELFAEEAPEGLALEEYTHDDNLDRIYVTIGFNSRGVENLNGKPFADISFFFGDRRFKVVEIRASDGHVLSLKDRLIEKAT